MSLNCCFEYSIVIATRNRSFELANLLRSIANQQILPRQVIIVSSGEDISRVISDFSHLSIIHKHTEISGQINQKRLGLELLDSISDWVLFLDDDLELFSDAVHQISIFISSMSNSSEILGIGLNEFKYGFDPMEKRPTLKRRAGTVNRWGTCVSYMNSERSGYTQWLNGASIWRSQVIPLYNLPITNIKYAFGEDLIFSYSVNKIGKLYYLRAARYMCQRPPTYDRCDSEIWRSSAYWRYYFVTSNEELSKMGFLLYLHATLFAFLIRCKRTENHVKRKVFVDVLRITSAILHKKSPDVFSSI